MNKIFKKIKKRLQIFLSSDDKGSAIILALIIIAGLAGTGIGAMRLSKSNLQQTSMFEDSLKAYYAAESGVEAALLEWRFNHDVELWDSTNAKDCATNGGCTDEQLEDLKMTKCVTIEDQSSIINGGNPVKEVDCNIIPRNQPWYEMKIYYRDPMNPTIGDVTNRSNITNNIKINKDQTVEYKFTTDDNVRSLEFAWFPSYNNWLSDEIRMMWHPVAQKSGVDELVVDSRIPDTRVVDKQYFSYPYALNYKKLIEIISSDYESGLKNIRLKCLLKTSDNYENGVEKGVYLAMRAKDEEGNIIHVPLDETTIEVVGHYNDTARKLVYKINRQAGTILDIFDFGVFSKQTFKK